MRLSTKLKIQDAASLLAPSLLTAAWGALWIVWAGPLGDHKLAQIGWLTIGSAAVVQVVGSILFLVRPNFMKN